MHGTMPNLCLRHVHRHHNGQRRNSRRAPAAAAATSAAAAAAAATPVLPGAKVLDVEGGCLRRLDTARIAAVNKHPRSGGRCGRRVIHPQQPPIQYANGRGQPPLSRPLPPTPTAPPRSSGREGHTQ